MARITVSSLAGIGFAGAAGSSSDCCTAVLQLLFYGRRITSAMILTNDHRHCLLLTVGEGDLIAVKSGFASGYAGEGPRTLSLVLEILQAYAIDIEELDVDTNMLDRLDASALRRADVEELNARRPIRPSRWYGYLFDHSDRRPKETLFQEVDPRIPLSLIDARIIDLAIHFEDEPDSRLLVGYRRLEDVVRARTGLEREFGARLFQAAFGGEESILHWEEIDGAEQQGRMLLFTGTYMAHRNPRAHQEIRQELRQQTREFMLLNHLFALESVASIREVLPGR
jgi:hypothetical protein